jgi:membrane-bound lytic murein transglycosylase B
MQFLPTTWEHYGIDGDGDGRTDLHDVDDSVFGAAHLLCANGGHDPARLRWAVWNYNHSWTYVDEVLAVARRM